MGLATKITGAHRSTPLRLVAVLAAVTALTACDVPADQSTTAVNIPQSPNAGPGTRSLPPATATRFFKALCVDHRPGFKETPAAAAANGFVQHSTFGTFYHPKNNQSVKLIDGECSMVFGSTASLSSLRSAFEQMDANGGAIRFRRAPADYITPLYNARIK